jgi:hypothetical protein
MSISSIGAKSEPPIPARKPRSKKSLYAFSLLKSSHVSNKFSLPSLLLFLLLSMEREKTRKIHIDVSVCEVHRVKANFKSIEI